MSCKACLRDIRIASAGLCSACYQRWRKRGSFDYEPKRVRSFCQIDRCGKPVVAHGMCDMHRRRFERHGDVHNEGPDSWGAKTKHPLYHSWAWMQRHKSQHPIDPAWDDFLQFVLDVGERPDPVSKLFSADETKPLGPDNFVWKRAITQAVEGEDAKTTAARRQRVYRAVRGEAFKGYELKRNYGLSRSDFEAMFAAQDGKCAICRQAEKAVIGGKKLTLSVDHCHKGGHIRGLLCSDCNRAIGMLKDDPNILRSAIAYLERHTLPPPE